MDKFENSMISFKKLSSEEQRQSMIDRYGKVHLPRLSDL